MLYVLFNVENHMHYTVPDISIFIIIYLFIYLFIYLYKF